RKSETALIVRDRRAATGCSARNSIQHRTGGRRHVSGRKSAIPLQRTKLRVASGNVICHGGECSASRIFDVIVILRRDYSGNIRSGGGCVIGHNTGFQVGYAAGRSVLQNTATSAS